MIRFSRSGEKQAPLSACDGDLCSTAAPLTCATAHGDIRRCADVDVSTELRLQGHVSVFPPSWLSIRLVCASAEWKMSIHGAESRPSLTNSVLIQRADKYQQSWRDRVICDI